MAKIQCLRCKTEAEGYDESPLVGVHAAELLAHTCPPCFGAWMDQEVMMINEYRLDLSDVGAQEKLNEEMARFLGWPSAGGAAPTGPPTEATPEA